MTKKIWLISHPSGAPEETPTFFKALDVFGAERVGVDIVYPPVPPISFADRLQQISSCDLLIAEVSIASTGSGVELGIAHAAGKDIIAFHQGTSPISPIVPTVVTALHVYISPEDILDVLRVLS